ncbi:hypothetical protein [Edaphobacter sp. 12200R-103]|uniref:hypothetical protein n=1 Tax=Edaphobacter sp. 12200R-103 TaxID=2703788 RepID=UPI00138CB891|nr:hypothetical protein [Edaphobacter sp. 12200R-103]QHS50741.1 hypothetical protein GWR55_02500 [Edaphobacter sp. 12200R-103]
MPGFYYHSLAGLLFTGLFLGSTCRCQIPTTTIPSGTPVVVGINTHLPMRLHEPVQGYLRYPVFVNGIMILPAKTEIDGTVTDLLPNRPRRNNARLNGDFTPFHTPVVRFTSLTLSNGTTLEFSVNATSDGAPVYQLVAPPPRKGGFLRQQYDAGMQMVHDQLHLLTAPHKGDRLLQLFYHQLPYHPERIESGTSWTVETTAPIAIPRLKTASASGTETSSSSGSWLIRAYLDQSLSSATAKAGEPIKATVAEPIYNPDHSIAVPQGAVLIGAVTTCKPARSFGRAGLLRFDFKQIVMPEGKKENIQTALAGVDAAGDGLQMNAEGKVKPKPQDKLVVPLILGILASRPLDEDAHFQGGKNFVGANGIGLAGNIIGWTGGSRYIAAGIGAYGTTLSIYRRWIASGHQVSFPRDTRIVLQATVRRSAVLKP